MKSPEIRLALVGSEDVDKIWHLFNAQMQIACQRSGNDDFTSGLLWQIVREKQGFLILAYTDDEIRFASVWRFEDVSFRCLMMCGNGMKDWLPQVRSFVTSFAKDHGAQYLISKGRRGWLRVFREAIQNDRDYEVLI